MPNTKNFSLRVRILDGLLQQRKGVSIQDCLRVIRHVEGHNPKGHDRDGQW